MKDCELLQRCPFFNNRLTEMPSMAELFKKKYCKNDWASCARYMIRKQIGIEHMPENLWPNQQSKAEALIAQRQ